MARDRLTADGERFYRELEELASKEVRVGFQSGEATNSEGADLCNIAMWNELGTVHIPSRPFLRQSADDNEQQIVSFMTAQAESIKSGTSAEDVLKRTGVMMKGLVQEKIGSGNFAPNAPSTIKKKGSATPLIDTGALRQNVNFQIKSKGE